MNPNFRFPIVMQIKGGITLYRNSLASDDPSKLPRNKLPILFVHGMWSNAAVFQYWLLLAEKKGIPAYAISLRGHDTPDLSILSESGVRDYIQDALAAIKFIGDCIAIGHSMGALILQFAAQMSEHVKKLVLVTSAPSAGMLLPPNVLWRIRKYMGKIVTKKPFMLTREDLCELCFNAGFDDSERGWFIEELVHESGKAAHDISFWKMWVKPIGRCSTLVLGGGQDKLTPASMQKVIAYKHAARYEVIPNACHMIQLQPGVREEAFQRIVSWAN